MKKINLFGTIILVVCCLFIHPAFSFASTLPPGFLIGDEQGIKVERDGKYFIEVNDVMPGKKWTKKISLVNLEEKDRYSLTMDISNPRTQGKIDLSKEIAMELIYDGKTVYEGPLLGINDTMNLQKNLLDLGVFAPGTSRTLIANFSVSSKLTNQDFSVKNIVDIDWTFYAIKTKEEEFPKKGTSNTPTIPKETKKGIFPNTGEEVKGMLLFFCIGLYLILTALLIFKKRHDWKKTR